MRRKGYLAPSGQKSNFALRSGDFEKITKLLKLLRSTLTLWVMAMCCKSNKTFVVFAALVM